jgi:lipopolysaccharide export system protein LptA
MKRALVLLGVLGACLDVWAQPGAAAADAAAQKAPQQARSGTLTEALAGAAVDPESETNAPAPVQLSEETHIRSESVDLGIKTRTAVYRGNVRLDDPRLQLTCEYLFANIPEEGQVDRIVAETNVVIALLDEKGFTNWAYADKAVYTFKATASETNELVELTGSPRIEREEHILYGDTIIWDRIHNEIRATNQRMGPRRQTAPSPSTNPPPAEVPVRDTNAPGVSPDPPSDE